MAAVVFKLLMYFVCLCPYSVAQLKYICAKYPVAPHWYPAGLQQRARVDEYMAWQHANTRLNGSMVFRTKVIHVQLDFIFKIKLNCMVWLQA